VDEGEFKSAEEVEDAFELRLRNPAHLVGEIRPESHADCNCMAVQQACRNLEARTPNMTVRVWSALMAFPRLPYSD